MKGKRGQVTIFIVVGLILVALAFLTYGIISKIHSGELLTQKETPLTLQYRQPIANLVESCLRVTAEPAVYLLGRQGGRIYPENALITEEEVISYSYVYGETVFDQEDVKNDLNTFIEQYVVDCVNDFLVFQEEGLIVEQGTLKSNVLINYDNIGLHIKYPLTIWRGEDSFTMKDFSTSLGVRLGYLFDVQEQIIDIHEESPLVYDLAEYITTGATVVVFPFDEDETVFSVYDEQSGEGLPYYYWFALKDDVNNPPVLDYISNFVLTKGLEFSFTIDANDIDNDKLVFSTDDDRFPISEDGEFLFVPQEQGVFHVTVMVEDVSGLQDEQEVRFVVE